jgi:DNA-binding NtrC family response regulator
MGIKKIFLLDDDKDTLELLSTYLENEGVEVQKENVGERALTILKENIFDVVISDLMIDDVDGIKILKQVKEVSPRTEVIIVTGHASVDTAVRAMKLGAFDYINKPINLGELNIILKKAFEHQSLVAEVKNLRSQVKDYYRFVNIVSTSPNMQGVMGIVKRIASSDATVLIEGESGTGKEVIARAIHNHSMRSEGPFVAINCGALPETLLESELFGHVKGAFTGATVTKKGLFEEANNGTIFLDEIGETSQAFQIKLLRVLQENEIRRVGDTGDIYVNARVLASSNTVLRQLVDEGRFRQDLYFRLRVIPVFIPPLRERKEDIIPLAKFFIERYCKRTNKKIPKLGKNSLMKLEAYSWPGNVRELENAIERSMILVEGDELTEDDILIEQLAKDKSGYDYTHMTLKELEQVHIEKILNDCGWNQKEASRRLGIGYNTLWRKIKEYNIERT